MTKRYVSVFIAILIFLASFNAVFLFFAIRTNHDAARAFEERHAMISAIYESSIAGGAFTRLARYYAITGNDLTYELFFAELELDRYGQAQATLLAYGALEYEIERFNTVTGLRMQMLDIHTEVIRLRSEGYVQESINLAHGPELQAIGVPAGPMSDEVRDSIYERTTEVALESRRISVIFGGLAIAAAITLTASGLLFLIFAGITGMGRRLEIFGMVVFVLSCLSLFFSVSVNMSAGERLDAYEQQYALINASYNAERGGEILTRMSRMFIITGNQAQYNSYFAELERDRFGHALESFILMNAESSEINTLVDVLGRLTMLRQIEAQAILLRATGFYQEALETAFSAEVAALDGPLAILGEELREAVNNRTQTAINNSADNHALFGMVAIVAALLLAATGLAGLFVMRKPGNATGLISDVFKQIRGATIRAKLFASFAIVISLFTAQVGISLYFDMQINRLNRHNSDYLVERSEILWDYHQEFTEMRRLLRETFLSPSWLEAANEAEWLLAERSLSTSHARLVYLKEVYEASIIKDQIFPVTYEDSRIVILGEIMSHINMIYELYRTNFFLSGNMTLYTDNVVDYTGSAEVLLRLLRQFVNVNREAAEERIMYFQYFSTTITALSLATAFVLAILLAFSMLKSFAGRIKAIEEAAEKVAQGDFEAGLQGGDEITTAYSKIFGQSLVAQEANRAKSRFLARMSHEIRTPISAVLGISEIELRSGSLPYRTEEAFGKIHDSALMLLNIINDILDFSKIESGKMPILDEEYEVTSLANDAAQLHTVYLEHKNIDFQMHIDENLPARLIGDMLRIRQIISNLISNAFKYTDSGTISLSLGCGEAQGDDFTLAITIKDTGFGMSQEQLEIIKTNEYSRFHEQEERFISGTGLGIPIVYSLVQMMRGQINFESEVGKGTSIVVNIPQKTCGAQVLGTEAAIGWKVVKKFNFVPEAMPYGKVLVVDDVDANLFVAQGLLAFYDISVDICRNGLDAIDRVKQGIVYDIVLMDYLMPGLDGIETMKIMRDKGYNHPIVALTANALVGQAEEFIESGFDDFISKPIQTTRLNEVLIKFIRNKQLANPDGIDDFLRNTDIVEKLRIDFAKSHKNTFLNISQALEAGDIKTAHRLAHTIKGSAGLIGENTLAQIAGSVEGLFKKGEASDSTQLSDLENELTQVLNSIKMPEPIQRSGNAAKAYVRELLNKLEPLLKSHNIKCLDCLDELHTIPEAAILASQIEDYDFELAYKNLETLRHIFQ